MPLHYSVLLTDYRAARRGSETKTLLCPPLFVLIQIYAVQCESSVFHCLPGCCRCNAYRRRNCRYFNRNREGKMPGPSAFGEGRGGRSPCCGSTVDCRLNGHCQRERRAFRGRNVGVEHHLIYPRTGNGDVASSVCERNARSGDR